MKKYSTFLVLSLAFSLSSIIHPYNISAQNSSQQDTNHYVTYPRTLTTRFFLSRKHTAFTLPSSGDINNLQYRGNTKVNAGIGATYHNFSLSFSCGIGFISPNEGKGKTKGIDLQFHFYPRKWVVDALATSYKGYYFYPKGYPPLTSGGYYYRPDLKLSLMGLAVYRLLNGEKFSYRAAMVQNEWQKKSAGSVMYGGEAYYGTINADSPFVSKQFEKGFSQAGINKITFFNLGTGMGYAYTVVIQKHFFITGSLITNIDLGFVSEHRVNGKNNKISINPAIVYKGAAGYNGDIWNVSVVWAGNALWLKGASSSQKYFLPMGDYRFVLARKIGPGKK